MGIDILWLHSVDSTNSEAKRRIADLGSISVIAAINQIAGRGQNGNKWFSESSTSLTFSIVLKDLSLKACEQSAISEATSLAIVDTLATYDIRASIKWPNDIYINNKKISGILIENSVSGEKINWSIIGIGLNVNQTEFPPELPNPTSMSLCSPKFGQKYNIEEVLNRLTRRAAYYYEHFLHDANQLSKLSELYQDLLIERKNIHLHNAF